MRYDTYEGEYEISFDAFFDQKKAENTGFDENAMINLEDHKFEEETGDEVHKLWSDIEFFRKERPS